MSGLTSFQSPSAERAEFGSRQSPPPGPHVVLAEMGHDVESAIRIGAKDQNNRDLLELAAAARASELAASQAYGATDTAEGFVIQEPSPVGPPSAPTETPAGAAAKYKSEGSPATPNSTVDAKL